MKDHIENRDRGASRNEYLIRSRRSSADGSKKGAVAERAHGRSCVFLGLANKICLTVVFYGELSESAFGAWSHAYSLS